MTKFELIQKFESQQDAYISQKDKQYLKDNSQFFTPSNIANKMMQTINMEYYNKLSEIKILEPSAGCGILILHIILYLIEKTQIENIVVDVYEFDNDLCFYLNDNLVYLEEYIKLNTDINLKIRVFNKNFILKNSSKWNSKSNKNLYNIIISNPPFKKINQISEEAMVLKEIIYGQPNIYTLFIAMSLNLLEVDGTYVVISPRSYLVGEYTKKLRKYIFSKYSLNNIHSFADRTIFRQTYQEIIISTFVNNKLCDEVELSHNGKFKLKTAINNIIFDNNDLSLVIPKSKEDILLMKKFSKLNMSLKDLSIKVSVGPVVQFRNSELLLKNLYSIKYAPLLISNDIRVNNILNYYDRVNIRKTHNKSISLSSKYLIKNSNYLLLRKVTAKGDKNTIISAVLEKSYINHEYLGLDNNLLYFHSINKERELSKEECYGLYCFINSKYFKEYYSLINGTHTINVSDFKNIRFPNLQIIIAIGQELMLINKFDECICSDMISRYL